MTATATEKTECTLYEVSFDNEEPYGVMHEAEAANSEGMAVITFPGNGFNPHEMGCLLEENVLKLANKLRKYLETANLSRDIIRKIPFYIISYKSPAEFNDQDARTLLYKKHGRKFIPEDKNQGTDGFSEEEKNPAYIDSLYNKIIRPRISRLNGKIKTDAATAARNMAQVVMFAHCHGAYSVLKLEELMRQNMQKLGYTKDEILDIQKQITVIAYAPACPLGVSKMNIVSYMSLNDSATNEKYNNALIYTWQKMDDDLNYWMDTEVLKKESSEKAPFDFKLSFYPDALGNVFVIKQKYNYDDSLDTDSHGEYFINQNFSDDKEHNNLGAGKTEDSQKMFRLMINALANACCRAEKQAKQQALVPQLSVQELVTGTINPQEDLKIFKEACLAGIEQGQKIEADIKRLMAEQRQQQK